MDYRMRILGVAGFFLLACARLAFAIPLPGDATGLGPCDLLERLNRGGVVVLAHQQQTIEEAPIEDVVMTPVEEEVGVEAAENAERFYRYILEGVDREVSELLSDLTAVEQDPDLVGVLAHEAQDLDIEFEQLYLNADYGRIRDTLSFHIHNLLSMLQEEVETDVLNVPGARAVLNDLVDADFGEMENPALDEHDRAVDEWLHGCVRTRIARETGALPAEVHGLERERNIAFIGVLQASQLNLEERLMLHVNDRILRDIWAFIVREMARIRGVVPGVALADIDWVPAAARDLNMTLIEFSLLRVLADYEAAESWGIDSMETLLDDLGIPPYPAMFLVPLQTISEHPRTLRSVWEQSLKHFNRLYANIKDFGDSPMMPVILELALSKLSEYLGKYREADAYSDRALRHLVEVLQKSKTTLSLRSVRRTRQGAQPKDATS